MRNHSHAVHASQGRIGGAGKWLCALGAKPLRFAPRENFQQPMGLRLGPVQGGTWGGRWLGPVQGAWAGRGPGPVQGAGAGRGPGPVQGAGAGRGPGPVQGAWAGRRPGPV